MGSIFRRMYKPSTDYKKNEQRVIIVLVHTA